MVIRAGNMSLGVNLLVGLTKRVAAALGPDFDIEIIEAHHHHKVDAPSGTALMLGEAAAAGRGVSLSEVRDSGRDGITGARRRGDIGFHAIRGGDVVGEHEVLAPRLVHGHGHDLVGGGGQGATSMRSSPRWWASWWATPRRARSWCGIR